MSPLQPQGTALYRDAHYSILFRLVALLVYVLFFGLCYSSERWLSSTFSQTVAAGAVLLVMVSAEYAPLVLTLFSTAEPQQSSEAVNVASRTRPIFYLIICNELLLPFSRRVYPFAASTLLLFWEVALTFLAWGTTTHLCYQQQTLQEQLHLLHHNDSLPVVVHTPERAERTSAVSLGKTEISHLLADMLFYLLAAGVAFYVTYLLEIVNRRAFLDHRKCVESKYKLTHEKDEQERLLSSCLPRHLMKKVREDIRSRFTMNRDPRHFTTTTTTASASFASRTPSSSHLRGSVKKCGSSLDANNNGVSTANNGGYISSSETANSNRTATAAATSSSNNQHGGSNGNISRPFKELYIDKHENVTILFADIINSMLLTSVLSSPKALVETLNDLFGRFDACAEVLV